MQNGDLVSIEFTGRDTSTQKIFDTTQESMAREANIYREHHSYGPVSIVIGAGEILPGLEEALLAMQVGETKKIVLLPEKAFGNRNPELVRVLPLSEFKKHNVPAVPGTIVNADNRTGKVQSVSGGRVRVDFNPDLAGREVEYELKILKQFTQTNEKLDALTTKAFPQWKNPSVTNTNGVVELKIPIAEMEKVQRNIPGFAKLVLDTINGTTSVVASTLFTKKDFETMHTHEDGSMHAGPHGHE